MALGAYQKRQFGPIRPPRVSSPLRRRIITIAVTAIVLLSFLFLGSSHRTLGSLRPPTLSPTMVSSTTALDITGSITAEEWPKNIWQTGSHSMKVEWESKTTTWMKQNPGWKYELLTDDSNTLYVEDRFKDRPSLVSFWHDLNVTILRADLVRYLTMLADGGVYSDMDTSCIKPVEEWIPKHLQTKTINAVVGVEYDDNTYRMFVRPVSFCQWTLMARPKHPLFEKVVARVIYHLEYLARIQATNLTSVKLGKKEVLEATGPGTFTDAVIEVLADKMGRKVDWSEVSGLMEPKIFGDVLVLPINAFGSGQKHSHSSDERYGDVLARHHFGRSWYKRPANDPVESKGAEKKREQRSSTFVNINGR